MNPPYDNFARSRYPLEPPRNTPVYPLSTSPAVRLPTDPLVRCAWCLCDAHSSSTKTIDSHHVCHKCIREQFEKAVRSEDSFPLKWNSVELRPEDHQDILPKDLVQKYKAKKKEYQTPPHKRIYCKGPEVMKGATADGGFLRFTDLNFDELHQVYGGGPVKTEPCGAFVGAIKPLEGGIGKANEANFKSRCKHCKTQHCLICGETYVAGGHRCSGIPPSNSAEIPPDWVRGKDYQICPSSFCERLVELIDGCNHTVCKCGQSFCFVCGEPAAGNSLHWDRPRSQGGCPQYNHPSQPNANWNRALPDDDELDGLIHDHARLQRLRLQARMLQEQLQEQEQREDRALMMQREQHPLQAQAQAQQAQQEASLRRSHSTLGYPETRLNPTATNYMPRHTERRNAIAGPIAPFSNVLQGPGGHEQPAIAPYQFDGQMGIPRPSAYQFMTAPEPGHDEFFPIHRNDGNTRGVFHPLPATRRPGRDRDREASPMARGGAEQETRRFRQTGMLPDMERRTQARAQILYSNSSFRQGPVFENNSHLPRWSAQPPQQPLVPQQGMGQWRSATMSPAMPPPFGFGGPMRNDQPEAEAGAQNDVEMADAEL